LLNTHKVPPGNPGEPAVSWWLGDAIISYPKLHSGAITRITSLCCGNWDPRDTSANYKVSSTELEI